jgi:hypothetical protein
LCHGRNVNNILIVYILCNCKLCLIFDWRVICVHFVSLFYFKCLYVQFFRIFSVYSIFRNFYFLHTRKMLNIMLKLLHMEEVIKWLFFFLIDEYTVMICSSCIDPFTVTSDGKIQFYDIYSGMTTLLSRLIILWWKSVS